VFLTPFVNINSGKKTEPQTEISTLAASFLLDEKAWFDLADY
jgi:hypothetical protein